ncbi:MAG: hypothetical protein OFPII_34140 [Osedax symbiont Rs1]|nr:MAG: hypothetical protein OFPII_34140 [Osedax symbiont Rs1]
MTSLHHIAQALDSTAIRKIPAEPTGAAKIFQFHRKTNILHSVFTLKSRIQVKLSSSRNTSNADLSRTVVNLSIAAFSSPILHIAQIS